MKKKVREEFAIVLDFLPMGDSVRGRNFPVAQVIGRDHFILLEVTPKKGVTLERGEEVYIGPGKRDKINSILGKLKYEDLTPIAKEYLEKVIEDIVSKKEEKFVSFFNNATAITKRLHMLELLPGIGKKHLWQILEERNKKKFSSFKDIKERIKGLPDPKKIIVKRIIMELKGEDKYRLFVGV